MAIVFDTPVTITPVTNIPNTWTDIETFSPKALGPVQIELTADNQSGTVTDALDIRFVSSDGVLGFSDEPVAAFSFLPSDAAAKRIPAYVIPGVYRSVKIQAKSGGATDQYTVSGSYGTVDPDA